MKSDINDLCEAFLAALTNAGYAVKSIENYKQVSNRFKKFCAENGYDTYSMSLQGVFGWGSVIFCAVVAIVLSKMKDR